LGKIIQLGDFGVIPSEDVVTSGHSGICGNNTVIGSSNRNTWSTQSEQTNQRMKNWKIENTPSERGKGNPYPPLLSYGDQLACCFVMVSERRMEYTENGEENELGRRV